jgi:hypothetical protein
MSNANFAFRITRYLKINIFYLILIWEYFAMWSFLHPQDMHVFGFMENNKEYDDDNDDDFYETLLWTEIHC